MPPVTHAEATLQPQSKGDGTYQLQSLERAVAVLEMLGECDTPLTLAEICRRMQLHKSTVHRSLMVLERRTIAIALA